MTALSYKEGCNDFVTIVQNITNVQMQYEEKSVKNLYLWTSVFQYKNKLGATLFVCLNLTSIVFLGEFPFK